jgi:Leucine-rich repeat (LRR) protein
LPFLEHLDLSGTQVEDQFAKELGGLTALRNLSIRHTPISDGALKYLEPLTNLEELDVGGVTRITDAGILHICKLTNLSKLNLEGTQVTAEGVLRLRRSLRKCKVFGRETPP